MGLTYSTAPPIEGKKFTCKRCKRVYGYPEPNGKPVRCECGWWYWNLAGQVKEKFLQRIDPQPLSSR
ncbi:MAG: hypothetical protein NVSMB31_19550 [Vulcanimicrobiaceae bacterium]